MMTQMSNSDLQATAEAEETSFPSSPAPKGLAAREGSPYITTSAVGSEGEPTGTPTGLQGESEEVCMDSDPGLEGLVEKVDQHYRKRLRDTNLRGRRSTKWLGVCMDGRQCAVINQWMQGVKPKTPWEVNCMVYAAASILQPQKSPESAPRVQGYEKRSACGSGN